MKAILFGSIGVIAETSELQREAFNQAFKEYGLDWSWDQQAYASMLEKSGGIRRVEQFAALHHDQVDAAAIHSAKFEIFRQRLKGTAVSPRSGVLSVLEWAKARDLRVGLVTTTYRAMLETIIEATEGISLRDFDVMTDLTLVENRKPSPDCYRFALEKLGVEANECIAIEDNVDGIAAAVDAEIECLCFPGENTQAHAFPKSVTRVESLTPVQFSTSLA